MKKLDNHGWGLAVAIVFMLCFFVFLLIIAVLSYRAGIGEEVENTVNVIETE